MKSVAGTNIKYNATTTFLINNEKKEYADLEPVFKKTIYNIVRNGGTYGVLYYKDRIVGCWSVNYKIKKGKVRESFINLTDAEKDFLVSQILNINEQ